MQPADMFFSSSKTGHFAQILTSGLLGDVVVNQLTPPTPGQVQAWGTVVIQVLVGFVTIWATVRKALQKPEAVVKVPAATVAVTVPPVAPTLPDSPTPADGTAE